MTSPEDTLVLVMLIFLSLGPLGCSYHREVHSQVNHWSIQMLDREMAAVGEGPVTPSGGKVELTFREVLRLARQREPALLQAGYNRALGVLQHEQVLSERWPRLDLNTSFYIPLGDGVDGIDDVIYGGLFIKYDLFRAAFNADAASVADSLIQRACEEEKGALSRLYWRLADVLLSITYYTKALEIHASALEEVERGLKLVEELSLVNKADAKTVLEWQAKVRDASALRNQSAQQLSLAWGQLKHFTGLQRYKEIVVSDANSVLAALDGVERSQATTEDSLSYAWRQRSDLRIAEIDVFLAEMAILDAQRSRLPRLSVGLGLGSMHMYESWGDHTLVSLANISVPLFDCGDATRRISKATLDRNVQRQKMVELVRSIVLEVQETSSQVSAARENFWSADEWRRRQKKWIDDQEQLSSVQRLGPLDLLTAELAMSSAEQDYHQALWTLRRAIVQWKKARCDRLEGWEPDGCGTFPGGGDGQERD